jgi:uncharacterized protein YoxC
MKVLAALLVIATFVLIGSLIDNLNRLSHAVDDVQKNQQDIRRDVRGMHDDLDAVRTAVRSQGIVLPPQ